MEHLIHTKPSTQTQYIKQIKAELSSLAPWTQNLILTFSQAPSEESHERCAHV